MRACGGLTAIVFVVVACGASTDGKAPEVDQTSARPSSIADPPDPSASSASAVPVPAPSVPAPTSSGSPTVVPTAAVQTTKARLDEPGKLGNGVKVDVTKLESVKGVAKGPGEVGGAAVRVTLEVANGSDEPIATGQTVVNLYYGKDDRPASGLSGPGVAQLPGSIKKGRSATARYVFAVPQADRDAIRIEFSYTTQAPTVVFSGKPDLQ